MTQVLFLASLFCELRLPGEDSGGREVWTGLLGAAGPHGALLGGGRP